MGTVRWDGVTGQKKNNGLVCCLLIVTEFGGMFRDGGQVRKDSCL